MRTLHGQTLTVSLLMAAAFSTVPVLADEQARLDAWIGKALLNLPPQPAPAPPSSLEVRRQDHARLMLRRSVLDTPLRIGGKEYAHGLGTHANSEILVRLTRPAVRFEAHAGIDDNHDTDRRRGSAVFAVEVAGQETFRSTLLKGGDAPVPVRVDLAGATEFTLRVSDGGDGTGWDQSDWADAAVIDANNEKTWLEVLPIAAAARWAEELPFSFTYGGKPSKELIPSWKRDQAPVEEGPGQRKHVVTWTDPATGLVLTQQLTRWTGYPAVEWVLRLENKGAAKTPIIENLCPLDLRLRLPASDAVLHHSRGSTCEATDFLPLVTRLNPNADLTLAPKGGRSSDSNLPFFNLAWPGGGLVCALGWSGQWSMHLQRPAASEVLLQAGQQFTHFTLHPGEAVRTPRILLISYEGDERLRGNNLLRRTMLDHYVPRRDGQIAVPPLTQLTWFTFNSGNDVTEANQLECIRSLGPGVEYYWIDAGWFEGGWPAGAGSWDPKPAAFPRGLVPLGEAAHQAGKGFVVWFEPERVNPASRIGREHPEWVLRAGDGDGLFNLGDPAANAWLADYLSKRIADWGIDIFRNDFNIQPLPFWQKADAPDRVGITEMRYIEGLYTLWDTLRARKPGLLIDNCASGGRRIDLEMCSRSFPLWHSDTQCCGRAMPVQDQVQTAGLSAWVPLHSAGLWGFRPYEYRSVATTGANLCMDTRQSYDREAAVRFATEIETIRPLQLGDYYPLLDVHLDEQQWCAWQFDRPEMGRGYAVFFRRPKSPYSSVTVTLGGIEPTASYEVRFADSGRTQRMSGADLQRLRVDIDSAPASALVLYEKQTN